MVLLRADQRQDFKARRRSLKPFARIQRGQGRFGDGGHQSVDEVLRHRQLRSGEGDGIVGATQLDHGDHGVQSVVGLVLPTGYAFNHDGTCLYFAAAPVFLAQAVGIELTLVQQLGLLGILLVTSKGGAGVAGSAIAVLVSTLAATGTVPVAAVGIILGVHRLMSSAFVAVNTLGNVLATIVVAGWEGAVDHAALKDGLDAGPL